VSEILFRLIQSNMTSLPEFPSVMSPPQPPQPPIPLALFGKENTVQSRLATSYAGGLVQNEEDALESLAFSVMPHRETEIAMAEAATFDWIFA